MSFGLGQSFGRLCNRQRTLEDVYLDAKRIDGWERHEDENYIWSINLNSGTVYIVDKSIKFVKCIK